METWGYNERAALADNRGLFPQHLLMNPKTADRVPIPWNATPVVSALAGRYPMELSTDPGRFPCNDLIYELYSTYADVNAETPETTPVCFIHVPRLGTKIAKEGGEFVADRETLGMVLREFVEECVAHRMG